MKFTLLLGLFACYLLSSTLAVSTLQQSSNVKAKKTTILNLGLDCLLIMFDQLSEIDLLTLGDVHEEFTFAVRMYMRKKVFMKGVIYQKTDMYSNIEQFRFCNNSIEITDLPIMLRMLKCFGDSIPSLDIRNSFDIPETSLKMPLLKELKYSNYDWKNEKSFIGLIKNNPQIEHLTMKFGYSHLLQVVAEELNNLQSIVLSYYGNRRYDFNFHFEHVKSYKMNGMTGSLPTNLTFGQIEEFDINEWDGSNFREIFSVVFKHKHTLKRLRLNIGVNDTEIFELANADMRLVDLSLQFRGSISLESFEKILESPHLNRLEICPPQPPYTHQYPDFSVFQNDWSLTRSNGRLLFERRQNLIVL